MDKSSSVSIIGAGSWGTALAQHLAASGRKVCLWGRNEALLRQITEERENKTYFPGFRLHEGLKTEGDLERAVRPAACVLLCVPAAAVREVCISIRPWLKPSAVIISTAKGLESGTLKTMSAVITEECPGILSAVLSGPSFALEVMRAKPTAVTVASESTEALATSAQLFHHASFRVYRSSDVVGVEIGGVVKNVIALAVGIVDGLQMGANARAALITRGLAEIQRLAVALGGNSMTVVGLSGLGDLLLTCTGNLSRNRTVGLRLGQGERLEDILESLGQVAEGVRSTGSVLALAQQHLVSMPIAQEVDMVLTSRCTVAESVERLLAREQKDEFSNI